MAPKTQVIAILSLLTIVVSIIGLADSGYVTYEKLSGIIPACGTNFSCNTVLGSNYAYIGSIPISAFGFLFYAVMLGLGIFHYLELPLTETKNYKKMVSRLSKSTAPDFFKKVLAMQQQQQHLANQPWQFMAFMLSIAGFLFTLYLVFVMAVVLQAWCLFCIVSAISSTSLFLIHSTLRYIYTR
jgi:uncharacterized membrane protein